MIVDRAEKEFIDERLRVELLREEEAESDKFGELLRKYFVVVVDVVVVDVVEVGHIVVL